MLSADKNALPSHAAIASLGVDDLRALVSPLIAENASLKARLAEFEGPQGRNAAKKCPRHGCPATEPAEIPMLPNEIFAMIGKYLAPGSRNLSNLARTCRGLYELLCPRLFEQVSVWDLYRKLEMLVRPEPPSEFLPRCLDAVKRLETRIPRSDERDRRFLAYKCKGVVELGCDWDSFCRLFLPRYGFLKEQLEVLNVSLPSEEPPFPEETPAPRSCPKLRVLRIEGKACLSVLRILDNYCPNLDQVHVDFPRFERGWDPTRIPERFLQKIHSWECDALEPLVRTINHFPTWPLETIVNSRVSPLHGRVFPRDWQAFCRLTSLRSLDLYSLNSFLLLSGLPPKLEKLSVRCFHLNVGDLADLGRLDAVITSVESRIAFSLMHDVVGVDDENMDEEQFRLYVAEMRIWERVPGFRVEGELEEYEQRKNELGI